jgi:hypothetical protein
MHDVARDSRPQPRYPRAVFVSGLLWIINGCLLFFGPAVWLGLVIATHAAESPGLLGGFVVDGWLVCFPLLILALLASLFVMVGILFIRGMARDTLVVGIVSLVLGLPLLGAVGLVFASAVRGFFTGTGAAPMSVQARILFSGIVMLAPGSLVAAGVMLLGNRRAYLAWVRETLRPKEASKKLAERVNGGSSQA